MPEQTEVLNGIRSMHTAGSLPRLWFFKEGLTRIHRSCSELSAFSRTSNDHLRDERSQAFLERVAIACRIGHALKEKKKSCIYFVVSRRNGDFLGVAAETWLLFKH